MAGLTGTFFDTSLLIAGTIDFGHSSQHALLLMDAVADGRIERPFSVHDLQAELREEFLVSAAGEGTAGGRIYDAHIAEIARQSGARLVATENRRHFTPLLRHGIRVLVSAELVDEIGS